MLPNIMTKYDKFVTLQKYLTILYNLMYIAFISTVLIQCAYDRAKLQKTYFVDGLLFDNLILL